MFEIRGQESTPEGKVFNAVLFIWTVSGSLTSGQSLISVPELCLVFHVLEGMSKGLRFSYKMESEN